MKNPITFKAIDLDKVAREMIDRHDPRHRQTPGPASFNLYGFTVQTDLSNLNAILITYLKEVPIDLSDRAVRDFDKLLNNDSIPGYFLLDSQGGDYSADNPNLRFCYRVVLNPDLSKPLNTQLSQTYLSHYSTAISSYLRWCDIVKQYIQKGL